MQSSESVKKCSVRGRSTIGTFPNLGCQGQNAVQSSHKASCYQIPKKLTCPAHIRLRLKTGRGVIAVEIGARTRLDEQREAAYFSRNNNAWPGFRRRPFETRSIHISMTVLRGPMTSSGDEGGCFLFEILMAPTTNECQLSCALDNCVHISAHRLRAVN